MTDCNVMLGKLQPEHFPAVFGPDQNSPLDADVVAERFAALTEEIRNTTGDTRSPAEVAEGFLKIAVENMANAIKKISVQRGYDVTKYTLCAFGGAAGQHACLVADALGMTKVLLHPLAGVLSAYGIGLADIRALREQSVEVPLGDTVSDDVTGMLARLADAARGEVSGQGVDDARIKMRQRLHLRYEGTDTSLEVDFGDAKTMADQFAVLHRQRYGFTMSEKALIVETAAVEAVGVSDEDVEHSIAGTGSGAAAGGGRKLWPGLRPIWRAHLTTRRSSRGRHWRRGLPSTDRPSSASPWPRPSSNPAGARPCPNAATWFSSGWWLPTALPPSAPRLIR